MTPIAGRAKMHDGRGRIFAYDYVESRALPLEIALHAAGPGARFCRKREHVRVERPDLPTPPGRRSRIPNGRRKMQPGYVKMLFERLQQSLQVARPAVHFVLGLVFAQDHGRKRGDGRQYDLAIRASAFPRDDRAGRVFAVSADEDDGRLESGSGRDRRDVIQPRKDGPMG